jgi:DNA-binding MarR family transcriptional regulator/ribosomal protein S18 acetylase RimI-like enzyme
MTLVDEVRAFNRFYTREIGLLDRHLPASDLSLPEARVLYELAVAETPSRTAADIGRALRMDKAHLSRIIARLRTRSLVQTCASVAHAKHVLLSLTEAGRRTFGVLEAGTRAQIDALLVPLDPDRQARLAAAMREVRALLTPDREDDGEIRLRGVEPGDLGWIVHRQTLLYHREYGWDWTYEGLAADILGQFVAHYDPLREGAWIAEYRGTIVGSVFLVQTEDPVVAKLRLLYVEPSARGRGLGRRLVDTCVARAREIGYRRLSLWTNDVLTAARHIYESAGFRLESEAPHHSFGHDLVGQTWTLDLE